MSTESHTVEAIRNQLDKMYWQVGANEPSLRLAAVSVWAAAPEEFRNELRLAFKHDGSQTIRRLILKTWMKSPQSFYEEILDATDNVR